MRANVFVAIVGLVAVVAALGPQSGAQPPGPGRRFALPKPGTPLPQLSIYDWQGKPFRLEELRGSWTVLIFGCLT